MEFVLAKEKDVDEIFTLYQTKEQSFKDRGIKQWANYTSDSRFPKKYFLEMIQNKKLYVLKQENIITSACVLLGEEIKNFVNGRSGSGTLLLHQLSKMCTSQGLKSIKLECRDDNAKLRNYYENQGFEKTGEYDDQGDIMANMYKHLN